MRLKWLLLSCFSFLLFALPAQAGKLVFWRFESTQNRLTFTTDDRVQPRAQLIPNPTRIVIDLPGIGLGRPGVNQTIGGAIREVRVAQFNAQTARLVIELAPGYTVDPKQVRIRGLSPTQWTVELPTPERVVQQSPPPFPSTPSTPQSSFPDPPTSPSYSNSSLNDPPSDPTPTPEDNTQPSSTPSDFQVTRNGLVVRLDRNGEARKIQVKRSRDRKSINIDLPGARLTSSLAGQTLPVNQYTIGDIKFEQKSNSTARITLNVSDDSPEWQAIYTQGAVVLIPKGGLNNLMGSSSPPPTSTSPAPTSSSPAPTSSSRPPRSSSSVSSTIESVQLFNNNQLVIEADQGIRGSGNWNSRTGEYEIRIVNAQLATRLRGPRLSRNSPIYQLRIRQESPNTAVIFVKPALGIQLGALRQLSNQQLAIDIRPASVSQVPPSVSAPESIPVPPPANPYNPPPTSIPSTPSGNIPQGRTLVVIDPGHGGKDPGAIGIGGLQEKDVILPISQEVAAILQQQGVQAMLTRNSDYFVTLQGRTDMANRAGADLFVSIHANAVAGGRSNINGLEVYYFGNRTLADTIHRNILRSINISDRGVRAARFYVLRTARMPSTLVEVGFVTGSIDNAYLRDPGFRSQMAQAIARGILEYIQRYKL
ncbi:N-acetylmuramoyl-L-alanine amidase [Gloeothece verrucosa]|uniref:N-acetylmuramoyl-L-alanine amidase n=1 Tax=Gloeothece verrucosa (strain PCC 7822) TaxID=497965 RepID=E0UEX4_GLOV7|nr:N-acetylmuramoyl-L-alanine amidase [Gloeothece verrucosa]ADN13104.1 N-acetylmuramoyl-L-alanine amidase [Gloeothece verrucosa PCC 7822]